MKSSLQLFSPAKINLFFRVIRKRDDGYHEVVTRLQTLSFGDVLTFTPAPSDTITTTDPSIPTDSKNLIAKALHLFRQETGISFPLAVHLDKRVPARAGLGGGSSNAATALYAVNHLAGSPLTEKELCGFGAAIGADVPFFFSEGSATCRGFGEIVANELPLEGTVWLVVPDEKLATKDVFVGVQPSEESAAFYGNDLEANAFSLLPRLRSIKVALTCMGFHTVWMTGSGSTLVAIGNVATPSLPRCRFIQTKFLNRKKETWYALTEYGIGEYTCTQKSTTINSL